MSLQVIRDGSGNDTGVFVPMSDWQVFTQDVKTWRIYCLRNPPGIFKKRKLLELAETLPKETGEAMLRYVEESRNEWEERLEKQFH